tara:strand:+ start:307 stop:564 length:258 start_codon:yes stop_codon:yes gene_type:complete
MNKVDNENTMKDTIKEWKKRITANKNKIKRRNIQIKELKHNIKIGWGEDEKNKNKINKLEGEIMGFCELKEIFEDKVSHEETIKK